MRSCQQEKKVSPTVWDKGFGNMIILHYFAES